MATIVTRSGKGSPLTNTEVDANFTNLNTDKIETDAEVRAAVEAASDSNVFTDADHTKLDGVETGATADQTAAEILTAVKTVDGATSGLDADLLDGQHGSYYTGYTDTAVSNLVDSSPAALNTLNELAAALGDDASFSSTVNSNIAAKLPLAGGAMTGAITTNSTFDGRDVAADGTKLDGVEASADVTDTANVVSALTAGANITIAADGTIAGSASYAHPNHSGEVTSTGDGATVISDNVVDEANLKVSNSPTNGYFLSAQSGNSGGLTWATVPAGYNDADVASYLASASSVGFGGRITADAGIDIDNIIIDGSTITSNTHLNLDIVGDLRIDVDGAEVKLADGGVEFGQLYKNSNDFAIFSSVSDGNLLLQGNDGGSTITALTLDMSDAGSATFNHDVQVPTGDLHIGTDSSGSYPKTGHSIRGGDSAIFSRTGSTGETLQVRRQNTTGEYVRFYSGASTIDGGIKVDGGSMVIGGGDVGIGYYQGANALVPYDYGNNTVRDAAIDLGTATSRRWKNLYLSGTGYVGTSLGIGTTSVTDPNWGTGNKELAIDGTTGYGIIHLRGTGAGSADTRYSMGVGDGIFYMAYDDVDGVHRVKVNASHQLIVNETSGGGGDNRVFHEGYHPNADVLTTARTINGVSFNGSANITVADSTKLPLAGGTLTGQTNFNDELRINNGNGSTTHFNYSDNGSNYIRGTSLAVDCDAFYSSGAGAITLNDSDIRSSEANPAWTGNPGVVGKIQYHSNRWYFVGGSSSDTNMITFRKDSTDVAFVRNNGEFDGEGLRINGTLVVNSSGAWVGSATGLTGPQGPQGPAGNNGSTGSTGPQGPQGPAGPGANQTLNTNSSVTFNTVTAASFNATSDINLKTNIKSIENPLGKISELNGYSFNWKDTGKPSLGVMAQEVEKVLPSAVTEDQDGTKSVNYNEIIGVLVEAVKAQQIEIVSLKEKLDG